MKDLLNWRLEDVLLGVLLVACVGFQSCYALLTVPGYAQIGYILLVLSLVATLAMRPIRDLPRSPHVVACSVLILTGIVLSTVWNSGLSFAADTVRLLLVIAVAAIIATKVPFELFLATYISLMRVLTVVAIAVWIVSSVLHIAIPLPESANFRGLVYQVGYIFFQSKQYMTGFGTFQCMSIFWEPGIYSSFLLIAIALETCGISKRRAADIALFSLAVVLTFSTAGIVMLPIALLPLLFRKGKKSATVIFSICVLLMIIIVFNNQYILNSLAQINPSLFGKLVRTDLITTSTRMTSPQINFDGWMKSPILGLGLDGASRHYEAAMNAIQTVDSMTSTSTFLLSAFGLTGLFISMLWIAATLRLPLGSAYQKIILLLTIIIILNKETHTATMLLYCLLFYFIQQSYIRPRRPRAEGEEE